MNVSGQEPPVGEALLEHRRGVVADEIRSYNGARWRGTPDDLDAEQRDAMIAGLDISGHPDIARYRRYENTSIRRMEWALNLILRRQSLADAGGKDQNGRYSNGVKPLTEAEFLRQEAEERAAKLKKMGAAQPPPPPTAQATPQPTQVRKPGLASTMSFLFPLAAEEAEKALYGPVSERFPVSDRTARRERQKRSRLIRKARELEHAAPNSNRLTRRDFELRTGGRSLTIE